MSLHTFDPRGRHVKLTNLHAAEIQFRRDKRIAASIAILVVFVVLAIIGRSQGVW